MKAIICDCCGRVTDHATDLKVVPVNASTKVYRWSDRYVKGEYCDYCYDALMCKICELRGFDLSPSERLVKVEGEE